MKPRICPDILLVAIRAKCMDCSGRSRALVENCVVKDCPLYPFRSVNAVCGADRIKQLRGQMDVFDVLNAAKGGG